ncbi:acyl dehydratase [Kibdelosporangium banguiense]|uniref:Acyl dehydratase n=1 Tax=Kibdelosporangium banguiense TaxID=1365924 RepID=A0ABS4TUG1_9PSEU|nr:MaoC family dehydratase [Kibdelosporangium banguiense]MBP2328054.1 acyl dehydratase [Kibdelosporangium banguiense]
MNRLYYEDAEPGVTQASRQVPDPVEVLDFVRYAGASGDFNPIHFDGEVAQAAGYPAVFGQGAFTAGVLSRFVTDWLGASRTRRFSVQFRRRLLPGDTITCTGTIISKRGGVVEAELAVTNGRGEVLVDGYAAAALPVRENV